VIVPINALGGSATLSFLSQNKLIIAVEDNQTTMRVDVQALLANHHGDHNIIIAKSYAEAAGLIAAHRAGILLESLTSSVKAVNEIKKLR
jgi:hypothetical protein